MDKVQILTLVLAAIDFMAVGVKIKNIVDDGASEETVGGLVGQFIGMALLTPIVGRIFGWW